MKGLLQRPQPLRQRPVCYRTHRTWWSRLQPALGALAAIAVVAAMAIGAAALVARLEATEAQLDTAYLRGMSAGQATCGGR